MSTATLEELKLLAKAGKKSAEKVLAEIKADPPQTAAQLASITAKVDAVEESSKLTAKSVGLGVLKFALGIAATAALTVVGLPHLAPLAGMLAGKAVDAIADAVSKPNSDSGYKTPSPFSNASTPKPRLV